MYNYTIVSDDGQLIETYLNPLETYADAARIGLRALGSSAARGRLDVGYRFEIQRDGVTILSMVVRRHDITEGDIWP